MPDQRWMIYPALKGEAQWLAQSIGLSPLLSQVLLNRDMQSPEVALEFLNPETLLLPSPLDEFPDLSQSVELLLRAIELQEKIAICGDYDADGMTSTALLIRALRFLGAEVEYAIPSRMQEGYGINKRIVEEFYAEGVRVILTVDNGIAAVEPIAYARELGLIVIVTDHHDVPPTIPPAHAILNPKLIAEESPYRGLAGVGVAYILAVCLAQALGKTQDLTAPLLELFTLGTIADLAPLIGVNRRWVRRGLKLLPKSRLLGVQALIQVAGLGAEDDTLKPEDIGFRLGPRINAVGRISDPQIVIEMLTTDDVGVALERAMQCEQANQARRELCDRIEAEAIAWCEAQQQAGSVNLQRDRVLLIVQPDWHHGVIGIVASRLVERYGVPVFIATYEDEAQKEIRGSARGIPEFNVFDALQSCHDLMPKFGGHRAAGGFSFPVKYLRQVKSRLINFANHTLQPEHLKPLVTVDVRASLADLTHELYEQIDRLHPCGIDNPDPVFWTPDVRVVEQRAIGKTKDHLKLSLAESEEATLVEAIAWRWGDYCPLPNRLDIAYKLKLNEWQGNSTVQLELVGVRPPTQVISAQRSPQTRTTPARATPTPTLKLPLETPPSSQLPPETSPASPETPNSQPAIPLSPHPSLSPPTKAAEPTTAYPSTSTHLPPPLSQANFFYSRRRYLAKIFTKDASRELQIHNPEGQMLVVFLPERQGYLCIPGEPARPVDVSEAYYFNLVRAGLNALEIRQTNQLLMEKDELLAEKDQHITTLTQQVQLLQAQLGLLSSAQQKQFQVLQAEVQTQETAIQSQEAHIATLQEQMSPSVVSMDPKAIKQQVRAAVGDTVWFCLQTKSQKDLYAAYKQVALSAAEGSDARLADYSEAGLRLGFVAEREVIQPFFEDLSAFLLKQGRSELGGVPLAPGRHYTLGMAASLIADQWQSLRSQALKSATYPGDAESYFTARAKQPLNKGDRAYLTDFLTQWEHPMGQWLNTDATEAAGTLDQISKLRNLAAHATSPLYLWAFDLMRDRVIGSEQQQGLFQHIYGAG